jgi:hypothetical protein
MNEGGNIIKIYCTGHHQEEKEGEQHVNGKHILCKLWKTNVWKMETGRTDYCRN